MALAHAFKQPGFLQSLPELPIIDDEHIRGRIVTHPSLAAASHQRFHHLPGAPLDYRKDAVSGAVSDTESGTNANPCFTTKFVGDALLKAFLTERILDKFPNITNAAATIILATAWSNATLARLAGAYEMQFQLRAASHQLVTLQYNNEVKSTLFEAFIGGLHVSEAEPNYNRVKRFIEEVFDRILEAEYAHGSAADVAQAVQANNFVDYVSMLNLWSQRGFNRQIEYEETGRTGPPHAPTFTVAITVNGTVRGHGAGSSLKEAKQAAAATAYVDIVA